MNCGKNFHPATATFTWKNVQLNHRSLGVPSPNFNLTTAGQITSTLRRSHEIQVALKILF